MWLVPAGQDQVILPLKSFRRPLHTVCGIDEYLGSVRQRACRSAEFEIARACRILDAFSVADLYTAARITDEITFTQFKRHPRNARSIYA